MRTTLRCFGLGMVFLAMIAATVSCRKTKEQVKENPVKPEEPWPILSVLEGTEWPESAASFTLYSDRRLVVRRGTSQSDPNSQPTFWTRILSVEEFELIDKAANQALRSSELRMLYDFGAPTGEYAFAFTNIYFGAKNKGVIVRIDGAHLLGLEQEQPADFPILFHENKLPEEFRLLWKAMLCVNGGDFESWQPSFIVVGFWPLDETKDGAVIWPDDWPKPELSTESVGTNLDWTCVKVPLTQQERLTKIMGSGESDVRVQVGKTIYGANYCVKYPGFEIWGWLNQPPWIVQIDSFCQCCPPPAPPKFKFDLPSKIPIGK